MSFSPFKKKKKNKRKIEKKRKEWKSHE